MVSKVTAAVLIGATVITTIPAYAEPSTPPPQAATQPQATPTPPVGVQASAASPGDQGTPAGEQANATTPKEGEASGAGLMKPATPAAKYDDVDTVNFKYIKGMFVDTGRIVASPVSWDSKDWLKVGIILGATGSLMLADQHIKDFAQDHQSHVASKFAMVGNDLGNGLYTLPPLGAFYLYGTLADDHKARRTALLALESFAISGAMTEGLKTLAGRHRPNTGDSPTTWDGPSFGGKNVSFSSGHTASAFSIATVVANEYGDNPWVPPIAYSLATLTGLARIYSNEHWASDVFFGGVLGYFTSKMVLKLHKEDDKSLLAKRLTVLPQVGKELTGLSVKYDF